MQLNWPLKKRKDFCLQKTSPKNIKIDHYVTNQYFHMLCLALNLRYFLSQRDLRSRHIEHLTELVRTMEHSRLFVTKLNRPDVFKAIFNQPGVKAIYVLRSILGWNVSRDIHGVSSSLSNGTAKILPTSVDYSETVVLDPTFPNVCMS